jgi:hypothetical protein
MLRAVRASVLIVIVALAFAAQAAAQATISYRFSFPDHVHHIAQVEATFADLPDAPRSGDDLVSILLS